MTRTAEAGESVKDQLTDGAEELVKNSKRAQKKLAAQAKKAGKEVSKSAKKAKQVADDRRGELAEPTRKAKKAAIKRPRPPVSPSAGRRRTSSWPRRTSRPR
ncbi:hypothetical protein [Saccharomonospora sp. CUA-673]|uniref:hypothetical protein n=1 Tax=Saccharomonospora sp. CUA-673 TaxID=1904969 RepID=UPI0011151863|nr:hypothetical protein [Saccharomonospora sp. CUA-673]